ncbi:MAG: hypothetical protein GY896_01780 [Gammaproteobacteria bacterium]|nr:hypothetical protein [Gammaproteobacteria bacterium]
MINVEQGVLRLRCIARKQEQRGEVDEALLYVFLKVALVEDLSEGGNDGVRFQVTTWNFTGRSSVPERMVIAAGIR